MRERSAWECSTLLNMRRSSAVPGPAVEVEVLSSSTIYYRLCCVWLILLDSAAISVTRMRRNGFLPPQLLCGGEQLSTQLLTVNSHQRLSNLHSIICLHPSNCCLFGSVLLYLIRCHQCAKNKLEKNVKYSSIKQSGFPIRLASIVSKFLTFSWRQNSSR